MGFVTTREKKKKVVEIGSSYLKMREKKREKKGLVKPVV